jgi:hypothetical protein
MRAFVNFVSLVFALHFVPSTSVAAEWLHYQDPVFGYSVSIPDDGFEIETDATRNGLTIYERDGRGQIDVYAVRDEDGLSLIELRAALADAERIRQITYSRSGNSWFVVSGYYNRSSEEDADLIFYAKFMISADRQSVSAFEASYPISDKRRYDPIIERMEDTLTPPG